MPQERLPKQALLAKANGRRLYERHRTRWANYIEDLGWNRFRLHPSKMMDVMENLEVWQRAAVPATLTEKREMKKKK